MIPLAIVAGYIAGLIVALLTVTAEHSRIALGSYALYGNGSIIVLVILAPFALYPGWAWLLAREGDRRLEAALYTVGLHFGVGTRQRARGAAVSAVVGHDAAGARRRGSC